MARIAALLLGSSSCGAPGQPIDVEAPLAEADSPTAAECSSDRDCVPAACCHADRCVAVSEAPRCEDVSCTAECRDGTIDCGGGCLCYDGRYRLRPSQPPAVGSLSSEPP